MLTASPESAAGPARPAPAAARPGVSDPCADLAELAAALAEGRPPPLAAAHHFASAVATWLEGDATLTLEQALGLAGATGRDSARTVYNRRRRDHFIRCAFGEVVGSSPWEKCRILAIEIEVFRTRVLPNWRHHQTPPPGASRLRTALFLAHRAHELPKTARRLHDICTWEF